jgi:AcrR family transcriptional regulator
MTKSIPRNEARQAMVERALEHLARRGPANVHPKEICEELALSKALVNYHFGGRDGLIADARVAGSARYVDTLWAAAEAAGKDPVKRLIAWVDKQIDWTWENPGLAAALNFPYMSSGMPVEMLEGSIQQLNEAGARNFQNLQQLVAAAKTAVRTNGKPPTATEVGLDAAFVGWVTLGTSVWHAGNHLPTQRIGGRDNFPIARKHVHAQILGALAR